MSRTARLLYADWTSRLQLIRLIFKPFDVARNGVQIIMLLQADTSLGNRNAVLLENVDTPGCTNIMIWLPVNDF